MADWPLLIVALVAGLAGGAVGSFIGTALVRMPDDRSILTGRSACDACGMPIGLRDLVPVVSWAILRGKGRCCGAAIGGWQWGCEVAGVLIGVTAAFFAPQGLALPAMLLGWQLLLLAVIDARHLWLPRSLTGLLALTGLGFAAWLSWQAASPAPLWSALGGGAIGFMLLWSVARGYRLVRGREGMGGGDPPLLGAIGLWLGPMGAIGAVIGASLLGLVAALALLLARRTVAGDTQLPLGSLLAAAAWVIFLVNGGLRD